MAAAQEPELTFEELRANLGAAIQFAEHGGTIRITHGTTKVGRCLIVPLPDPPEPVRGACEEIVAQYRKRGALGGGSRAEAEKLAMKYVYGEDDVELTGENAASEVDRIVAKHGELPSLGGKDGKR